MSENPPTFCLSTFYTGNKKPDKAMLNRVQLRAGLAVIYIAPRNLVQIGAYAYNERH